MVVRDFLDNPAAALVSLDDAAQRKRSGPGLPEDSSASVRDSGTMKLKEQSLSGGESGGYAEPDGSKVAASTGCAEVAFSL